MIFLNTSVSAQGSWQKTTMPGANELMAGFKNPPSAYGVTVTWGWNGPMNREVIARDLDNFSKLGFHAATIEAGYDMPAPYLSDGWFKLIQIAVEEAKKRGMHLWIIDEGKYPSGFAGGKFSSERPDLRMQGLIAEKIPVAANQTIDQTLKAGTVSAIAVNKADGTNQVVAIDNDRVKWTAPAGDWTLYLVQHQFRTSATRSANNPTHGKDGSASLCDYLNPDATRQFLAFTHEQYKKFIGADFGKTVLGFRGDEPAFLFVPWTPKIPEAFKLKKGYDILPYLASFFIPNPTPEQLKAKADYWDVWSDMFGENFFKVQGDWCRQNNLEYMVHLDKDDDMQPFVRSGGDFFKDLKDVQIPGVDVIWHQIWPDTVANFPKFASSVAHVYNKPRALSESFAAYRPQPNDEQAKWVIDQQLVRGINLFELMYVSSSSNAPSKLQPYMAQKEFPALVNYCNRACYLLSSGRPSAQIALYLPTTSLWMGDAQSNKSATDISTSLLNIQHDFDFVSEQALNTDLGLANGTFTTSGGTAYKTVIIPQLSVISQSVLNRLKVFTKQGGHVLFADHAPGLITGKTFLNAKKSTDNDFNWAKIIPSNDLARNLTMADFSLQNAVTAIKYLHRTTKDAEMYFLFNESNSLQQNKVTLAGEGNSQFVDAMTGDMTNEVALRIDKGYTTLNLVLKPYETKFIIISKNKLMTSLK